MCIREIVAVGREQFEVEISFGLGVLRVWRIADRKLIWSLLGRAASPPADVITALRSSAVGGLV